MSRQVHLQCNGIGNLGGWSVQGELSQMLWPVFVQCYTSLVSRSAASEAQQLMNVGGARFKSPALGGRYSQVGHHGRSLLCCMQPTYRESFTVPTARVIAQGGADPFSQTSVALLSMPILTTHVLLIETISVARSASPQWSNDLLTTECTCQQTCTVICFTLITITAMFNRQLLAV